MHVNVPLEGLDVMIGIPAGRDLHPLTVRSILESYEACKKVNVPISASMIVGSAVVQWARDEVVDQFLQSEANRLFWIDSDMVWSPGDFIRMIALSQLREVVCGAYPAKTEPTTFYLNFDKDKGLVKGEYGLIEINGAGLGFTVMSREVVEAVANNSPIIHDEVANRNLRAVFRVDYPLGHRRGEDMAFFADIRAHGYKVWLDPETELGHLGMKQYRGSVKDSL